ncbi:putative F-box protein At3g10430 [Neltuma alba]|uniref:putative F-box protein At3g10430 n=1 Tax=Neltuma alba TaxID=207710 RepID=UPI0010A2F920|nr:putative F-box protein At3g10430 [Prosopis alba]
MDADTPFLPQEIVTNILKRLPVKSLIRLRCVCKEWKNLIKTPSFIADHLQHHRDKNPLLIWHRCEGPRRRRLQMLDYKLRVLEVLPSPLVSKMATIVGSSNGLLCLICYHKFPSLPFLLLWNPATREAREVPQPVNSINDDFGVGFGFSPSVNDYKIVISGTTWFLGDKDIRVEVYSLSTRSWKEIKAWNFGGVRFYLPPVNANGAIFWFAYTPVRKGGHYDWIIISFDMAMEVFSLIPLPALLDFGSLETLAVYENKLAILSRAVIGNYESFVIDLWVMEEGTVESGERWDWSKVCSINTFSDMVPCCIWLDEIVCEVGHQPKHDRTALCLLNLNTLKVENFATFEYACSISVASNHVESLVPIGNIHLQEP